MALWTPAEIITALWLDASDSSTLFDAVSGGSLVAADGAVARWEDKSGNSGHATQSSAGARPVRKTSSQNSLDTLLFGASAFVLSSSLSILRNLAGASIFSVRKYTTTPSSNRPSVYISTGDPAAARANVTSNVSGKSATGGRRLDGDSFAGVASLASITSGFQTQCGVFDYANTTLSQYVDGNLDGFTAAFQSAGSTQNIDSSVVAFGGNSLGTFFNGSIAEIIIIQAAISSNERRLIEGYLAWKWGTEGSLPNDHPYKNAAPRTGALVTIIRQHYAAMGAR